MKVNFRLEKAKVALLVIDVQDKVYGSVAHSCEMQIKIMEAVRGFRIMDLPIITSAQYPKGLGETIPAIKDYLGKKQKYWEKTTFSCLGDPTLRDYILSQPHSQWVVCGIEAHVCVMQTVRDLIAENKQVVVLNDAISSNSLYDFSTAIAEMRDMGARISSTESVLFELVGNSQAQEFKQMSALIKEHRQ